MLTEQEKAEFYRMISRCEDYLSWIETDIEDGEVMEAEADCNYLVQQTEDILEFILALPTRSGY